MPRPATPDDVPGLLTLDPSTDATDLRRRALAERMAAGALGWCFVEQSRTRVSQITGQVLLRPGHLLGCDELTDLLVAPAARRSGVGRSLVAAAVAAAASDSVLASVPVGSLPARSLLAVSGWTVSGRVEGVAGEPLVILRTPKGPPPAPGRLYHLTLRREWDRAVRDGTYRASTLGRALADVGFVHCSFARQLPLVAAAVFRDVREPVVLLTVDRSRLSSRVLVEAVHGTDEVFPHVYGPIDLAAVLDVAPVVHDSAGHLALPGLP
jgi:glutathione S-transferase